MVGNRSKEELKSTSRDIFTWLILASVFFIPLQLPVGATSRLSLADLFVVLASPLLLLRFQVVRRAMLIAPLLFPLIMVYGALLGGLVNGEVLAHAMVAKVLGAVVLLFSLLSWLQVAQESDRGIFDLMKAFLLGSVVFTLFGLVEFYAGVSIITVRFIESRFSGGYFDPNHYGALTGVGLMFIAALGRDIFKRDSSIYVVGGILGVGFLLCISRGAWIATLFGILVVVVMRPIKIKAPVIALGVFVVLGVLFSGVLEHLAQDINDRPDNASHRLELITEGLRLFKDGHFVGIGLSVFLEKNEIIIHNSVVWMTVEMGIVGVALYLLFIAEPVVRLMRLRFRHWRKGGQRGDQIARISASLLGAHLLMAVASQLVEATYQRQWWLVLALTVGLLTRTNVSSSRRLLAFFFNPNKSKTNWAQLPWPKSGWPTPWGPLWSNTGTKKQMASGIGRFKLVAPDLAPVNEQGGQYADSSNDTYVSDPTVLLSVPISDSILTAYDQAEKEKNHADSADKTAIPDAIMILAEDDIAAEKGIDADSETQSLPISELILTDEERAEQETNRVNNSKDPFVSDVSIILAENDSAIEEETAADSETQYLPISELILTDEEQAEQEMNRINNSNYTFIYTAAAMLSGNDAEEEKEVDSETQYLPTQEMNDSGGKVGPSTSDGEIILVIDDTETEKETDVDSETQYLPIQEINHSGSTVDPSTSDGEIILGIDDIEKEKETDADSETQYLPIQEINHSGSTVDPSTSDGEIILGIDDIEKEKETDADSETQYLPIQEIGHSDSANDPSIFEVVDTLEEKTNATEKEANANSETQYLPVSESILVDFERVEQKTKHFGNTNEASIPGVEAIIVEDDIAMKEESSVGAGKQYSLTSDSIRIDNDQADQEMNRLDSTDDASISDAAVILAENDVATEEKISVEANSQYLPTSDSILIDNDRADQEANHSASMSDTLNFDAEKILEENSSATEKKANVGFETNYSQISEPSKMDIDQAEQETIHANGMNDTSIPGAEDFLAEEIGGARIHHTLNYDIEEIIGIEKQYSQCLREFDIDTTQQLLNKANTSTAITDISNHINKKESLIRTWISMADLIQIPGVRGQFSKLIAQSGVLSIKQLAVQDAHELAGKISDAYEVAATDLEVTAKGSRYRAEPDIDMVTVWIDAAKKLDSNEVGQEANYLDSTNETSFFNDAVIIAEDDIAMEEEASLDARTQNPPIFELPPIYNDLSEQETNHSDTDGPAETSLLHTEVVLEGNDAAAKEEISADSETQPIADSILINNHQIDQEMDHSDSANDTSFPAVEAILVEENAVIEKEANSVDVGTQYPPISDSILSKHDQADQEASYSDEVKEPFIPDVETILAEGDIETGIETNVDTEARYLPISDSILKDSDHAEQETNNSDSVDGTSLPDAAVILVENNSETEKETDVDAETMYFPIPDSILTNNDQAEQETNCSDSADETSLPDAAVILVENDSSTEKETDVGVETQYLPISESILTDNDQAEQATNRSNSTDETSLPDAEVILAEDDGGSWMRRLDYDIEEIKGIGKRCSQRLREIDIDTTQQLLEKADTSAAITEIGHQLHNEESLVRSWVSMADLIRVPGVRGQFAEQMMQSGVLSVKQLAVQDAHELMEKISDAYELTQKNSEVAAKESRYGSRPNIDMITVWIDAAKKLNNEQVEQEVNHNDGSNDTSLPEAEAIFAEDDIEMEKEINADAGKQYSRASDSTLIINDQVVQEANHVDNTFNTPTPVAAKTFVEDIVKDKAMNIDSEAQYLPISESILINNVQAEQETNHLDNTNNISIPTVAMILTEDVGDSPKDLRDYAIEDIRGIGRRCGQRLREINIETTLQLLKQAKTPAAVAKIGRHVNERESLIRAWISTADLMRVPGIRGQFAEQLVLSGVLSVKQLAAQDALELTAKNLEATAKNNHNYAKPSIDMVTVWIDAAKELNDEV